MHPLHAYLSELHAVRATGSGVKETSYYPAVSGLFNTVGKTLKPPVSCIINLKNTGAGIPDGGFFTPDQKRQADDPGLRLGLLPSRGVLEVKGAGDDVARIAAGEQVDKYWAKYGQVLVTNLRDFVLVGRDPSGQKTVLETFSLAPTEAAFWHLAAHPHEAGPALAERFAEYLKRVLLHAAPLATPEDLAWFLASYARDAKSRIETAELPALAAVRAALEEALGLKFEGAKGDHFFRSTLVQTLFYGIFSAWVLWSRKPEAQAPNARFHWKDAAWELHVPMIRALFEQVAQPSKLGPLGLVEVLEWTGAALNRVVRADFFARFDQGQAVQYFYEPFLQAFDPELRKDLGVWYTPPEIVRYMVARVDQALRDELKIPDGLADPRVHVLDPCCGTGAYLVEVLKTIAATLDAKGPDALGGSDLKQAAVSRVFGFEILPAPFVVAHLQLGLLLQNAGAPLSEAKNERVGVYLTNALTGWEPAQGPKLHLQFPELEEERDAAEEVKQSKPILVILGNPPYNAFAGTSPDEEQGLVEPYKKGLNTPVASGGWGIKKFNLDDLYVRFFRLAERRIAANEGVVCYVSNFSYLSDPSFVVLRQRFLAEFDTLHFDSLNGDSRETGKLTPEGKPDPSAFSTEYNREGIRVGTAIGLLVRTKERAPAPTVRFRQFWGVNKRAELLESLNVPDMDAAYVRAHPTRENRLSFRPSDATAHYQAWPTLVELCAEAPSNGLMEKRGGALISTDKAALESRMRKYYDPAIDWQTLKDQKAGLTEDAARFVAKEARAKVTATEKYQEDHLRRYALRPFDTRWCYYSTVRPLWNEPRPMLWRQCWEGNAFLLTRFKCSRSPEGPPCFFTPLLNDDHFLTPDAVAIPLRLRMGLLGEHEQPTANLSTAARAYLAGLGLPDPDADAETAALLWMHALAVGYSPAYLAENADGLRADWPRIPLPDTVDALQSSAALGRQVAALLDTEADVPGVTSGTIAPEFKALGVLARAGGGSLQPEAGDLKVSAGWGHAGQGGVTMPGRGKTTLRSYTGDEAAALTQGAEARGLTPDQARALLGESTHDVFLNDIALWKNVPARVWDYTIGGYQVLKKWLSYREHALLGRDLTPEEAREVTATARRLAALLLMQPALDANYQAARAAAFAWGNPPD